MTNSVFSNFILQKNNIEIEVVDKYVYLGQETKIVRDTQTDRSELSRSILLSAAFGKLNDIYLNQMLRLAFNQCVLPVLTYGAET